MVNLLYTNKAQLLTTCILGWDSPSCTITFLALANLTPGTRRNHFFQMSATFLWVLKLFPRNTLLSWKCGLQINSCLSSAKFQHVVLQNWLGHIGSLSLSSVKLPPFSIFHRKISWTFVENTLSFNLDKWHRRSTSVFPNQSSGETFLGFFECPYRFHDILKILLPY